MACLQMPTSTSKRKWDQSVRGALQVHQGLRDRRVSRACEENREIQGRWGLRELLVPGDCRGQPERMESKVTTENLGSRVPWGLQDPGAFRACRGCRASRGTAASPGWTEPRASRAHRARRAHRAPRGPWAPSVRWAQLDREVREGERVLRDPLASGGSTESRDHLALREPLENLDHLGSLEILGPKEI